jgi:hypothetical protein
MKFYAYIFYRFKNYYGLCQGIMSFNAIIVFNLMSLLFLCASIMHIKIEDLPFFQNTNNYFSNRLYIAIVDVIPIFLITYLTYRLNKHKFESYFKEFDEESINEKKVRNRGRILYFVFTVAFFVFSIASSSFL